MNSHRTPFLLLLVGLITAVFLFLAPDRVMEALAESGAPDARPYEGLFARAAAAVSADFSVSPTTGIAPLAVTFKNESTGDFDTCFWDFGDEVIRLGCGDQSHTYPDKGVYTASLTISGMGGVDTKTINEAVTVYTPVTADFSAAPTRGIAPLAVTFKNQSTGDFDTCVWDFGDNQTASTCGDQFHTYSGAGVYTVSLTVSGPGGEKTKTISDVLTIFAPVKAGFSAAPASGIAPLTVSFENQSTGDFDTCVWDFGDDVIKLGCGDQSHTYPDKGVYTASLTISGLGGVSTKTVSAAVTVYEPAQAEFSPSPSSGVAPLAVTLVNQSTGDFDTCAWDFGDGQSVSGCADQSHTYAGAGVYTVSLTVSGLGGSSTKIMSDAVTVYEPVTADFSAAPTSGSPPLTVTFNNLSSGDYDTCSWYFGDGIKSSTCQNPSHTYYLPGQYQVSLTISGPGGTDSKITNDYITVDAYKRFLPYLMGN